jgi:hypothetical protein
MTREQNGVDLNRVRIPSDLISTLDSFCSDLKMRMLEDAAKLRAGIPGVDRDCVLTKDDLLAVAAAAIEYAVTNLDVALSHRGSDHAECLCRS